MKPSALESVKNLLKTEDQQLQRLHDIVADTLKEQKIISQRLRREFRDRPKFGERIADKVTTFGGSWQFIILFILFISLWMIINAYFLVKPTFDPYPFILLNLILSCLAALQAPIILMSQNRLMAKDRKHQEHDYIINLKAELEIRALHQKLDMLMLEQIGPLLETQKKQLDSLAVLMKKNH